MTPYPLHGAVDSLPILEELITEALTAVNRDSSITMLLLALLNFGAVIVIPDYSSR
jgi:hypothetical protein